MQLAEHEIAAAVPLPEDVEAAGAEDSSPDPPNTVTAATTQSGYIKCALCNQIIDDEAEHVRDEHHHLQHIHEMLKKPLPPPTAATPADLRAVGTFAVATSHGADRGPEAFAVMQRAQQQLQRLLENVQDSRGTVYAFGSVVSMGCWDGVGDGDFAMVDPAWYSTGDATVQNVPVEDDNDDDDDDNNDGDDDKSSEGEKKEKEKEKADHLKSPSIESSTPVLIDDDEDEDDMETKSRRSSGSGRDAEAAAPMTVDDDGDAGHPPPQHHWDVNEVVHVISETDAGQMNAHALSSEKEKRLIRGVTSRLRDAGFRFEELDPVLHTRIPVVRRKRPTHDPLNLRAMQQDHLIRVSFDRSDSEAQFRSSRLPTLLSTYHARDVTDSAAERRHQITLAVPDSTDAVHLMSRRERIPGVRKSWVAAQRTAEIFAIDFDLSCRFHGIRNSWLLRRYLSQDAVFRMGNVFLKRWSKASGINNSRTGFLTSYAVSVLWVYFLLRRGVAAFVDPSTVPVLPDPAEQTAVSYIPLWPDETSEEADAARTTRLGTLLRDFFYFYGAEFDWATQVVSIRQPCPTSAEARTKADLNWLADDTVSLLLRERCYHICSIEDVYEDDLDLGRHLTPDKAAWVRLQFRLAYQHCSGGGGGGTDGDAKAHLMRILDDPRQRAHDVLKARVFETLLLDTDDAEGTIEDLAPALCLEDDATLGEDPAYLLSAYELSNRLSDLWYDEEQLALDLANHRRYDRRANLYVAPVNPVENGDWAAVCADPLPMDDDAVASMGERVVRLEPPGMSRGRDGPRGAPKRQRMLHLTKARNAYAEQSRAFKAGASGAKALAQATFLGLPLPKSAKGAVYPHCFFPLQQHRLFPSYDARAVFLQCLEDIAWEVARLHENIDPDARAILASRERLLEHATARLHFIAAVLPHYAEVLRFAIVDSSDYLHFERYDNASLLVASPLLRHIVGAGGSSAEAPAPAVSAASQHRGGPPAQRDRKREEKGVGRTDRRREPKKAPPPPSAANLSAAAPVKMNAKGKKTGTCNECKRAKVDIYPALDPKRDSGYYCAACWEKY